MFIKYELIKKFKTHEKHEEEIRTPLFHLDPFLRTASGGWLDRSDSQRGGGRAFLYQLPLVSFEKSRKKKQQKQT